jgi:hypothetical protein
MTGHSAIPEVPTLAEPNSYVPGAPWYAIPILSSESMLAAHTAKPSSARRLDPLLAAAG